MVEAPIRMCKYFKAKCVGENIDKESRIGLVRYLDINMYEVRGRIWGALTGALGCACFVAFGNFSLVSVAVGLTCAVVGPVIGDGIGARECVRRNGGKEVMALQAESSAISAFYSCVDNMLRKTWWHNPTLDKFKTMVSSVSSLEPITTLKDFKEITSNRKRLTERLFNKRAFSLRMIAQFMDQQYREANIKFPDTNWLTEANKEKLFIDSYVAYATFFGLTINPRVIAERSVASLSSRSSPEPSSPKPMNNPEIPQSGPSRPGLTAKNTPSTGCGFGNGK
jgi:hypothetical protein